MPEKDKKQNPSECVESRSDNSADNFPLKVPFSPQNSKKTPTNFWRKLSNWVFLRKKIFSWRNLSGQIKLQFWQSSFKVQKTSAECLEKDLKTLISNKKEDCIFKNPPRFEPFSFDNHAETFQKQYVILLLNFGKTNPSTSEKSYPIAYNLRGKKKSTWKNCSRHIKSIFDSRLKCSCQSTTKFCSISEKIS